MEKKDIKKVISSRKLIYIIAFLCVITMFNFNITSSRYMEEAFADNSIIATPILTFSNCEATYSADNLLPGATKEITFTVSNTDEEIQNEVLLKYNLQIETNTNIPLQYKLYEVTSSGENEITLTNNKTQNYEVGYENQYLKNYKLKILWNESDNSYEYAGQTIQCKLKLNGEQIVGDNG